MYNWEATHVKIHELESKLESVAADWEVFSILPATDPDDLDGPVTGRYVILVVRRPK